MVQEPDEDSEPTLEELRAFYVSFKGRAGGLAFNYQCAPNHEKRVPALEAILEQAYGSLVRNRHLNHDHSEDALTVGIIDQLKNFDVEATHDAQDGGHCDIHVTAKDQFLWIAEAKIHRDYSWLEKGFLQLSTRFGVSVYGRDHGEVIIYCRTGAAAQVLSEWKRRLTENHDEIKICEDMIKSRLWFRSSHPCKSTGGDFFTRHRIVPLFWEPEDKASSKKKTARPIKA